MPKNETVIASGNLATSRRTIMGVLGQFALFDINEKDTLAIFTGAGLPARALQEPDFPISLDQELVVCTALLRTLQVEASQVWVVTRGASALAAEQNPVQAARWAMARVAQLEHPDRAPRIVDLGIER